MEVLGFIRHAMETKSGVSQRSGKPWVMKDYVLEIPGQYPSHMVFTVFSEERIRQFALRKDEQVTIQFDIDASEYNGKWYNRITAYNVIRQGGVQAPPPLPPAAQYNPPTQPQTASAPANQPQGSDNDLPF